MSNKLVTLLILLTSSQCLLSKEIDWDDKSSVTSISISGRKQSPINLEADIIRNDPLVYFLNYNSQPEEMTVKNMGKTVQITGKWKNTPQIEVSGTELYTFENVHLHWSDDDETGTEHSICGHKYAAELRIVHLNSKYQTLEDVLVQPDGIFVIAILYEVDDEVPPNSGMTAFSELAKKVPLPNESETVDAFSLSTFFPDHLTSYYSYNGSLTTPPYSENVRWVVLANPQPINSEDINVFRHVKLNNGETSNIRPLQKVDGRIIELYTF